MDAKDFERSIYQYERVRECIVKAIHSEPNILGDYAWLRNAISDTDIQYIEVARSGKMWVSGMTWSNQTVDHEPFTFEIDLDDALRFW